jgi:amidase
MSNDLMFRSATELAALVRSGEVTSRELVEASYSTIGRLNDELNVFVTLCEDRALAEADAVQSGDDRPLAGVPIAIKDLGPFTEGIRTTFGTRLLGEFTPDHDSALVRRIRAAGAIIVGKTNTPEFGLVPVTEPERFGPARNPWNTNHTTGGSSGGSAGAVASGMVPIGHANDGGGSIRIPASCCGLVGLKPSRGRVSMGPDFAELVGGIGIDGLVSRTVSDTATVLDIISGYETGDPYWAPDPSAPFIQAVDRTPGKLRVAWSTRAPNDAAVHPECEAAAREVVESLESLGHEVTEDAPDWFDDSYVPNFLAIWAAGLSSQLMEIEHLMGGLDLNMVEPLSRELYEQGKTISAAQLVVMLNQLRALSRRIIGFWDNYDVFVTPTLAQLPLEIGALQPGPGEPAAIMMEKSAEFTPFTPIFNVTGQPAISLPTHMSADGLPVGVQLVGPPIGEELLLSVSAQLEAAAPWKDRRPELAAA